MSDCEYDLTLDDEQREIRDAAHKFAAEVLRPAGIELDRLSPQAVVAPDSPLYEVLRRAAELGYTRLSRGQPAQLHHSIASKVFCTQAALEVATLAAQLHGGSGLTGDYPVEMFLRDATAFTIADGENALLSQMGAS
jgi:alkylation response protein AidB-like acyl-CoA dehydrogenase